MTSNQSDVVTEKKTESLNVTKASETELERNESLDDSEPKHELKAKVSDWWQHEKDKIAHGEMLKFLQDNKDRHDKTLNGINKKNIL